MLQWVTIDYKVTVNYNRLQEGVTRGCRGLHGVTGRDGGLKRVTSGYKGLQGVTGHDRGLQEVTRGYKLLQRVTRGLRGVTKGYRE